MDLAYNHYEPQAQLPQILLGEDGVERHGLVNLLSVVPTLLQDRPSRTNLKKDLMSGTDTDILRQLFTTSLQKALQLTQSTVGQEQSRCTFSITSRASFAHTLTVHDLCTTVLQCLLSLFPLEELAASIAPLLDHEDDGVSASK